MARYRTPRRGDEFYIPAEEYHTVVNFCRCYRGWKSRLAYLEALLRDYPTEDASISAVQIDGMPHGSDPGDPTGNAAMANLRKMYDLMREKDRIAYKVKLIEDIASEESGEILYPYLMKGITEQVPFPVLRAHGMPLSEKTYSRLRRKVYFRISKLI